MFVIVFKIVAKYSKTGNLKYISHLDILRLLQRAMNRANVPVKYSEGFNPHIKMSFGFPLSLGVESIGEYFELEVDEKIDTNLFVKELNDTLPPEIRILKAEYSENKESLMSMCQWSEYKFDIETKFEDIDSLNEYLHKMANEGVVFVREKKSKKDKRKTITKEINTKDIIHSADVKRVSEDMIEINVTFRTSSDGSMKTDELMRLIQDFGVQTEYFTVMKIESLDKDFKPLMK